MDKIVFTGGEGVGKTSLLLLLQMEGENIIRETASDFIRVERARGNTFPTDSAEFEEKVLKEHLRREKSIVIKSGKERVFLDRGWIDHIAYGKIFNWKLSDKALKMAEEIKYKEIFFFSEPQDFGIAWLSKSEIERSRKIASEIFNLYQHYGYNPIVVKSDTLENRMNFILKNLKQPIQINN